MKSEYHDEGIELLVKTYKIEPNIPKGMIILYTTIYDRFEFQAFPGPKAAGNNGGKIEHLPYHFHSLNKGEKEIRIKIADFTEYDGLYVDSRIRYLFKNKTIRTYLTENTISIFNTGQLKTMTVPKPLKYKRSKKQ